MGGSSFFADFGRIYVPIKPSSFWSDGLNKSDQIAVESLARFGENKLYFFKRKDSKSVKLPYSLDMIAVGKREDCHNFLEGITESFISGEGFARLGNFFRGYRVKEDGCAFIDREILETLIFNPTRMSRWLFGVSKLNLQVRPLCDPKHLAPVLMAYNGEG